MTGNGAVSGTGAAATGTGTGGGTGGESGAGAVAGNGAAPAGPDSAERGATTVVERVVVKIAVQAAREALRTYPAALKVPPGTGHRPRASARVRDRTARVRVLVELGYPSDIGAQCAAVRRQVASRVKELLGMEVPDVAVGVERLHSEQLDGDRSGRVR